MKARTLKKRRNRLLHLEKWQKTYIAGHNYRWTLAANGLAGYGTWKASKEFTMERLIYKRGKFNKDAEKRRLNHFWQYKKIWNQF